MKGAKLLRTMVLSFQRRIAEKASKTIGRDTAEGFVMHVMLVIFVELKLFVCEVVGLKCDLKFVRRF
jgi:hypothetical protein